MFKARLAAGTELLIDPEEISDWRDFLDGLL